MVALLAVAIGVALAIPSYPNYDTTFHLLWATEILDGRLPGFDEDAAPTPHPGWLAIALVLEITAGDSADRAAVLLVVAGLVAMVWGVFRVGAAVFGVLAGAISAALVLSSVGFLLLAGLGFLDVPFIAIIVWAGVLEASRPRQGRQTMVLLALAGLLRPEAWVLAGAYWLWCSPRRIDLFLLAAIAPVLWSLIDLVVTGDPLFSVRATSEFAENLERERGISNVPGPLVTSLVDVARPPVALAGVVGMIAAWHRRADLPAAYVPFALFLGGVFTFVATGAVGLSIIARYLTVPAVALAIFAGYAATVVPRRVLALGVVGGLVFLVAKLGSFGELRRELEVTVDMRRSAIAIVADPAVRRCGSVTVPTFRLVPEIRRASDDTLVVRSRDPYDEDVRAAVIAAKGSRTDVYVVGPRLARDRYGLASGVDASSNEIPAGGVGRPVGPLLAVVDDCG